MKKIDSINNRKINIDNKANYLIIKPYFLLNNAKFN